MTANVEDHFTSAGSLATAETGQSWTQHVGSWTKAAGVVEADTALSKASIDFADADVNLVLAMTHVGGSGEGNAGLLVRFVDTSNFWRLILDGTTGQIYVQKVVSGSSTTLWNGSSFAANDVIGYRVRGNIHTITKNEIVLTVFTDSALNTATKHGLYHSATAPGQWSIDYFLGRVGGDAATGTAHGWALDGTTPNNDAAAGSVIDGADDTGWSTGGGGGVWTLDLGSSVPVDAITVTWIGNITSVMHLDTSVDGSSWDDSGLSHTQPVDYGSGSVHIFDLTSSPIDTRYWRWRTTAPSIGAFALMTFELTAAAHDTSPDRAPSDTVTGTDADTRAVVYARSVADTTSLSDAVIGGHGYSKSTADTVTGTDSVGRVHTPAASPSTPKMRLFSALPINANA